jgi:uncharacterized membrane protein
MRVTSITALGALIAPLVLLVPAAAAQTPEPLLPLPGDTDSVAAGINAQGVVVGTSSLDNGNVGEDASFPLNTAVVWNRGGTPTPLPPLPGDEESRAFDINARGEVAGRSFITIIENVSEIDGTGAVWERDGTPSERAPLPGDQGSDASAINLRGEVAGTSLAVNVLGDITRESAVVWDRDGTPSERPPLPGDTDSRAFGINNHGQAVGESLRRGDLNEGLVSTAAVLWDRKGRPKALPPLPGDTESQAFAINAQGKVVGFGTLRNSDGITFTAIVWDRKARPKELPPLPGDTDSIAFGVNARGEVVGESLLRDASGNITRTTGVLWDQKRRPKELPPQPGDTDSSASAINNRGEVVGTSREGEFAEETSTAVVWRLQPVSKKGRFVSF